MKYYKEIQLRDGRNCVLRNATAEDAQAVCSIMLKTHEETDYLLSYPDELLFTLEEERQYLQQKNDSDKEIEIIAIIDGLAVGTAGIDLVGKAYKVQHRAEFGMCVVKDHWRLGIGKALLNGCVECAREAKYKQLELSVVSDNFRAIRMYKNAGFIPFSRKPKGFQSRISGDQELIGMRLEL